MKFEQITNHSESLTDAAKAFSKESNNVESTDNSNGHTNTNEENNIDQSNNEYFNDIESNNDK